MFEMLKKQVDKLRRPKKGLQNVNQILPFAITLGVTVIALAYFLLIHSDVQADIETETGGTDTSAYNATEQGVETVNNVTDRLPTIATIGMAVLLIGLLVGGFMFLRERSQ